MFDAILDKFMQKAPITVMVRSLFSDSEPQNKSIKTNILIPHLKIFFRLILFY